MICHLAHRPAIQIGRHQVFDYDTAWLDASLARAAASAGCEDFPFVEEIRSGVMTYLETKCPLRLMRLDELFDRIKLMLEKIGCEHIAEQLRPMAPPVTVSLVHAAMEAGNGFELAFFEALRIDLTALREAGAGEIRFTGSRECSMILRGSKKWDKYCESLHREIESFLMTWDQSAQASSQAA